MQQLHEKISGLNTRYYDLRGEIVKAERRIATLTERGEMWKQYSQYKAIRKQLDKENRPSGNCSSSATAGNCCCTRPPPGI